MPNFDAQVLTLQQSSLFHLRAHFINFSNISGYLSSRNGVPVTGNIHVLTTQGPRKVWSATTSSQVNLPVYAYDFGSTVTVTGVRIDSAPYQSSSYQSVAGDIKLVPTDGEPCSYTLDEDYTYTFGKEHGLMQWPSPGPYLVSGSDLAAAFGVTSLDNTMFYIMTNLLDSHSTARAQKITFNYRSSDFWPDFTQYIVVVNVDGVYTLQEEICFGEPKIAPYMTQAGIYACTPWGDNDHYKFSFYAKLASPS